MMQSYQLATPRLAIGTAAVALAAITLGILVIIPATMEVDARTLAAQAVASSSDAGRDAGALIAEHETVTAPCVARSGASEDSRGRAAAL